MTELQPGRPRMTYHDLPPHPPLEGSLDSRSEHAAEPPPALPPADPSRIRAAAGGVLAVATLVALVGLTAWAIRSDDSAVAAAVTTEAPSDRTPVPGPGDPRPERSTPSERGSTDSTVPPERLDRISPFLSPEGDLQIPEGRLPGDAAELLQRLTELGFPTPDLVLPDGAVVRGLSFSAEQVDGERRVGVTIAFEVEGGRAQLTVSSDAELPAGEAVDLAGTPGVVDAQGRVVWRTAADTLTFTLESRDLDQAGLVELATEIERAMQ